jgi:hypothetical protein
MRFLIALCLIALSSPSGWASSGNGKDMQMQSVKSNEVKMRIGSKSFAVTLLDNESTMRLKEMFPLTIQMKDLNSNEKYFDLPKPLPTSASNPKSTRAGDIMLYGSNTLVVFYKSFPTTYSYTRLGQVNDPSKLQSALGSGDATVTFESE